MGKDKKEAGEKEVKVEAKVETPKTVTFIVKRAVDKYHHRGAVLSGPDDKYHKGLAKHGHIEVVPLAKTVDA